MNSKEKKGMQGCIDLAKLFLHKPDYSVWGVHLGDKILKRHKDVQ